ncbi:MAG: fibronectin type III domain-containing protein [Bacteroidota bacterium]
MNRIFASLFIFTLAAMLSPVSGQVNKIMPLGNSITEGWDPIPLTQDQKIAYRAELYNQLTAAGYSFDFVGHNHGGFPTVPDDNHAGISGLTDGKMLRLLQDGYDAVNDVETTGGLPYLNVFQPDIILLHIGTNDILQGQGATGDTISMILDEIHAYEISSGKDVVVFVARIINMNPTNLTVTAFNNNIAAIVNGRADPNIILVDHESNPAFNYFTHLKADGIHPNTAGDAVIGQRWFSAIDAFLPEAPTGLSATALSSTSIQLTWTDVATGETGYRIERALGSGGPFSLVTSIAAGSTTYTDGARSEGTAYYYRVQASGTVGSSAYSNEAGTTTFPAAPTSLSASVAGETSIQLGWTDVSTKETGYRVERSLSSGGTYLLVTTLVAGTTTYTDPGRTVGTPYYYRVQASGAGGNSAYSNIASATTVLNPPTGLSAVPLSASSIQLNWTDASANETAYQVERSLTSGGTYSVLTSTLPAGSVTYTDGSSLEGTTYFYRVRANGAANSAYSDVASATTLPAAPTGLTAAALDESSILLNWTDVSTKETGYRVERSLTSGGGYSLVTTLVAGTTTYTDGGRTVGTPYFYRVQATGTGGNSAYSNEASATPILTAPGNLTATVLDANTIRLNWSDYSDNESFYRVERSLLPGSGFALIGLIASNSVTYTDGGCAEGTTYYYRVQAVRTGGDSPYSDVVPATTFPATPTGLTAVVAGETSIRLDWNDNTGSETAYLVERSLTSGSGFALIQTLAANTQTYTDIGRAVGTPYFYRVRANGPGGYSAYSTEASATTALLAPTGLTAVKIDSISIQLNWTDNSMSETGYDVLRSLSSGTGFAVVATIPANRISYTSLGLVDGTRYYYMVRALTSGGIYSLNSNEANAITDLSAPTNLTALALNASSIEIHWINNSASETAYSIERSLSSGSGYAVVTSVPANSTSYVNVNLGDETRYYYRVRAIGPYGNSRYSNVASALTPLAKPLAPDQFTATALSTCSVALAWRDRSDNETGFEIERSLTVNSGFAVLKALPAGTQAYTDTSTHNSTTYYYRLRAFNAAGRSDSAIVNRTVSYPLNGGAIAADQTICPNGDPALLTSQTAPSGGDNIWSYQWQSRISPAPFANITGATGITYNPPAGIISITQFQRRSTVECGSVFSNTVTITPEDLEKPVFTLCPPSLELKIARNLTDTLVTTANPVFTDNCGAVLLTWTLSGAVVATSPNTGINYLGVRRFPLGITTVTYHVEDFLGNFADCVYLVNVKIKDPEILKVSIPNVSMRIGSLVPATITVANDGGSTYTMVSGAIGGYPLTGLQRINATSYRAYLTVVEGGNSYLALDNIPVSNLVLTDGFTQSLPYVTPISQPNDPLDARLPVITLMSVVPGDYKIGNQVIVNITADGIGYTLDPSSRINGNLYSEPNVTFAETGGGNYRLIYMVEEGDTDVARGELAVSVILIKPSGNRMLPFTTLTNVELTTIDAHPPVISRMEVPNIDVGVGRTVQVTITADQEGYDAAPGTVINGIPISSPNVSFSEVGGGLYELSYVVQSGDNVVPDGTLKMSLILSDLAGNISLPFTKLEPNTLEIYTDLPTVILGGTPVVCEEETANLLLYLNGGRKPWDIELYDGTDTARYENINSANYTITVLPKGTTNYRITRIKDVNGVVNTGSQPFKVTVNPKTKVEFIDLVGTYSVEADPVQLQVNVPGGTFSGPGVFSNGIFDPGIADTVNSPHTLVYRYQNANECISYDSALVFVLGANGDIYIPHDVVCDYTGPFVVRGSNVAGDTGNFALFNANGQSVGGLTDHGDNTATINPANLPAGVYTIEYEYIDEVTLFIRETFLVERVQTPVITSPVQLIYCQNDEPVTLLSSVPGALFSGPGVIGTATSGFMFDPGLGNTGKNLVTCTAATPNGCSKSTPIELTVRSTPEVRFELSISCIQEGGGSIAFSNLTPDKIMVQSWNWDFGDPASGALNHSTLVEPSHFYSTSGDRSISLAITTTEGCTDEYVLDTRIGINPVAQFGWTTDCFAEGTATQFRNSSAAGSAALESLQWTFRNSSGSVIGQKETSSPGELVDFQFNALNTYTVDLFVRNEDACSGSTSEEIVLRPTVSFEKDLYEEDFNADQGMWTIHADSTPNSWTWGTPDFTGFVPESGDESWYTRFPENQGAYFENSWVQSPCFDFSFMKVPMIQLDLMRSFVPSLNGAVLQYRDIIEQGWKTIGQVGSGIEWYNSSDISNKPGGGTTGWGLDVFSPDTEWITARNDLDELSGKKQVSFRLAIATTGAQGIGNQGFAFDNVRVSERSKRIVLEHFTNSGSSNAKLADDIIDDVARQFPRNVIDLQYHTATPGADPMNANNPYPPSTRVTVNGITEVPYTILDGGIVPGNRFNYEGLSSETFMKQVKLASLETPPFDIELEVDWTEPVVTATTRVISKGTYPDFIQLYVVVLEKEVTAYAGTNGDIQFNNVVLDMLPTTGILLGGSWYEGKTEERTHEWPIASYVEDFEDLVLVAFIQDRNSFDRLQSAVSYASGPVGVPDKKFKLAEIVAYPNPVRDLAYVNLGDRAVREGMIELIDMRGQVIMNAEVPEGYQLIQIETDHLNPGIYMIRWMESDMLKGISKIVKAR